MYLGPGCSSLYAGLTENGPFEVDIDSQNKTIIRKSNHSWNQFAHVLYTEAPVAVGFTQGDPRIVDNVGFAEEFYGFFSNFLEVFPEYKEKRIFVVGER